MNGDAKHETEVCILILLVIPTFRILILLVIPTFYILIVILLVIPTFHIVIVFSQVIHRKNGKIKPEWSNREIEIYQNLSVHQIYWFLVYRTLEPAKRTLLNMLTG